ncbi:MAG: methyltransferase domain-containing protein [bacterium]|nr:methyltransferase domain-containing protein [bacterium]
MNTPWFDEVQNRFQQQDWRGTEDILLNAIQNEPDNVHPRYHLANLYLFLNQPAQAVAVLEPLEDEPSTPGEYHWLLFHSRIEAGELTAAFLALNKAAVEDNFTPPRLRLLLGSARQAGGLVLARRLARVAGASRAETEIRWSLRLNRVLRLLPRSMARGLISRASSVMIRQGRWRYTRVLLEAIWPIDFSNPEWPRRFVQLEQSSLDPYDPQWRWLRNWLLIALERDPDQPELKRLLLETLFDMERWHELVDRVGPDEQDTGVLLLRAAALANLGETREAESAYRELAPLRPAQCAMSLGLANLQHENWSEAESHFTDASTHARENQDESFAFLAEFFRLAARRLAAHPDFRDGQSLLDELCGFPQEIDPRELRGAVDRTEGCPLCGLMEDGDELWTDTNTGWTRVRCSHCGMIAVSPMPSQDEILKIYTRDDRGEQSVVRGYRDQLLDVLNASLETCRQIPAYIEVTDWGADFDWRAFEERLGEDKCCVDVGCSAGRTVAIFSRFGWNAEGVDFDQEAVAFAQAHGVNARVGSIDDLIKQGPRYHLVTLVDVIEHVSDPRRFLRKAYDLLLPGGLLYIKTPAADSLPHLFVGDRWLESVEHLLFFSRRTLIALALMEGFDVVSMQRLMEPATHVLHYEQWQRRRLPGWFRHWIMRLQAGDSMRLLVRKPE